MKCRTRDLTVDFSRGIAMIIVVMGHAGLRIDGLNLFEMFIQSFQMPLFMLISGYSTGFSMPILDRFTYIKKKVFNLLIPYFCWISLKMILLAVCDGVVYNLTEILKEVFNSGFWFLRELFYIHVAIAISGVGYEKLIGRFTKYNLKRCALFIVMLICEWMLLYFVSALPGCYNIWKHYFFFSLGLILFYALKNEKITSMMGKIGVCGFGGFIISFEVMYYLHGTLWGRLADVIAAILGSVSIFLLSKYVASKCHIAIVEELGKRTLGIYAVHWILLFSLELGAWEKQLVFLRNPFMMLIVLSLLWLAISYFTVLFLEKVNLFRKLFLGN